MQLLLFVIIIIVIFVIIITQCKYVGKGPGLSRVGISLMFVLGEQFD